MLAETDIRISAAIIALDEEENLKKCIPPLLEFTDEIVIIDGGSKDDSMQVLKNFADPRIKCFHHEWGVHFGLQRQISFDLCTGDWIIRIDCDEVPSKNFRRDIRETIEELQKMEASSIRIRQVNLYPDICHYASNLGGWETHPRIFKKTSGLKWVGQVHEYVEGSWADCVNWSVPIVHFGWLDKKKYAEKEDLYMQIPGSGFYQKGSLVNRDYKIRPLPPQVVW